jgi:hypothetical protein
VFAAFDKLASISHNDYYNNKNYNNSNNNSLKLLEVALAGYVVVDGPNRQSGVITH